MERIAFFGKGGIGKSTVASNVSVILGTGAKVLHVGCDPKMDSTLSLMGRHIAPFTSLAGHDNEAALAKCVQPARVRGVSCIEAGGPQPGVGCAGTGIGAMLEAMKSAALLEKGGYGAAVFDVLGDVVCGGFAAPLRRGFARKAVIVVSEEMLSLYAANKLIQMVENYSRNGVFLAGLAVNAKKPEGARLAAEFARAVNTRVLGVIPRDPAVALAERRHRPAVLAYPKSPFAVSIVRLCAAIKAAQPQARPPSALSDADFFSFAEGKTFDPGPARVPGAQRSSAAGLLAGAGLRPSGMEGGQMLCGWLYKGREIKVIIAPKRAALPGMLEFSDWAACFHPSVKNAPAGSWQAFEKALGGLGGLPFDRLLSAFSGPGFYDGLQKFVGTASPLEAAGGAPRRPHAGFGQWQRFIFPAGGRNIFVPPGVVMVEHGDSECRFSGCEGGTLGMFRAGSGHGVARRSGRGPLLPKAGKEIFNTDFKASDAAAGDEAKMASSIGGAARKAKGGLVEFYVGCSPMMAASDVAAFTTGAKAPAGAKVLAQNYNSFNEYSPEKAAARTAYLARRFSAGAKSAAWDVNLLGLGDGRDELAALLAEGGIKAAPASEEFYAAAAASRLQVLVRADEVLEGALKQAGRKFVLPPAPYGVSGTAAWLKAVHAALGSRKKPAPPARALAGELAALRSRSRAYAAGFVASAAEILSLYSPEALNGVPVPAFLAEAGFALKFFVPREDAGKAAAAALAGLRARLPGCRLSRAFFGSREELAALLAAPGPLRIVYSDINRDPRVTAAGRTPFSSGLFEAGYEGAAETARRLLELCDWDFNEKYLAR